MNHKQDLPETLSMENGGWVLYCRPDKVSQPWSVLDTFDNKLSAIIKAYQVSADYFMVKVTGPDGGITWSN
jgi:phage pi2 protein 07